MRQHFKRGRAIAATAAGLIVAGALAAAGAALAAGPTAPAPSPVRETAIAWSTYLRAGPGETYAAISELEHDTPVKVMGCDGQWCQVSGAAIAGYVDRDALDLPRTLAPQPPVSTDCVVAGQADNRGPIPTRFCSAAPSGR